MKEKQIHYHPIFYWTEYHVWTFIEENNLPYSNLYDKGFSRLGCIICPFIFRKNQAEVNRRRSFWPKQYEIFEKICLEWWNSRKKLDVKFNNFESWLEAYYRGFET